MTDLKPVMELVKVLHEKHGVPQKGGKKYTQVVHRMEAFRSHVGTQYGIMTEILVDDGKRVVMKASITDKDGRVIGTGHAEEIRGSGYFSQGDKRNINTTSAIENCESSCVGRALSSLGISGGEYASANEMDAVGRKKIALKNNENDSDQDENDSNQEENDRLKKLEKERKEKQERDNRFKDFANQIEKINFKDDLNKFWKSRKSVLESDSILCKMVIDKCAKRKEEIQKKDQFIYDLNNGQRENYLG